jgi:hypothetical protein
MSGVIRCSSADVRSIFEGWVASESAAGARLVVLEGAMMSGKSFLTGEPLTLGSRQSINIEVDGLTRQTNNEGYIAAVRRDALDAAIRDGLAASPTVIVQGAIVWPLVQAVVGKVSLGAVRRVYLKRMKRTTPDHWRDARQFLEPNQPPRFLGEVGNSIDRHHAEQRPWLSANLVVERIEAEGEDND